MVRTGVVSWLRATALAFPTFVSGIVSVACCYPLQWRGRTGIEPVSVSPVLVCTPECEHFSAGANLGAPVPDSKRGVQARLE